VAEKLPVHCVELILAVVGLPAPCAVLVVVDVMGLPAPCVVLIVKAVSLLTPCAVYLVTKVVGLPAPAGGDAEPPPVAPRRFDHILDCARGRHWSSFLLHNPQRS